MSAPNSVVAACRLPTYEGSGGERRRVVLLGACSSGGLELSNSPRRTISVSSTTTSERATTTTERTTTTTATGRHIFAIGATVDVGTWQLVVHGVEDPYTPAPDPAGLPPLAPGNGNRFAAVDVEFTNKAADVGHPEGLLFAAHAEDPAGHEFAAVLFPFPGATEPPLGGMDPGSTIRGLVVFEVPMSAVELMVVFWPNPFVDPVRIALS